MDQCMEAVVSNTGRANRRTFLQIGGLGVAAAACAPAVTPPAPVAAPEAPAAAKVAWQKEWEDLVAAARKEGKVTVLTLPGSGYRKAMDAFQDVFPGIVVEQQSAASSSVYIPKIRQERAAGLYGYDLALVGIQTSLIQLRPEGVWAPIPDQLLRPDVIEDKAWRGGLKGRLLDTDAKLAFGWEYRVYHAFAINTDMVKEGEISTIHDVLNPKWRGKLIVSDVRMADTSSTMTALRKSTGDDAVRQLLVDQQPAFQRDPRLIAEAVVRGRNPIALGVRAEILQDFRNEGLGKNVKLLDLPEIDYIPGVGMLSFSRAPHPATARLFINWFLTREGQTAIGKNLPTNSARLDVEPYFTDGVPTPGKTYFEAARESVWQQLEDTKKYINGLVGVTN